ncbi:MAG: hypothetical protein A2V90_08750 [Gammaproteobacteria bacterium RBG_16_57_12]|nr:MAG: hypothetical protein A2V90_08750 [Gammaproteobacteria bacterium RBG_16_57_12]
MIPLARKIKLLWAGVAASLLTDSVSVFTFIIVASLYESKRIPEDSAMLAMELSVVGMAVSLLSFLICVAMLTSSYEMKRRAQAQEEHV